jgi:WD40 repeat protein
LFKINGFSDQSLDIEYLQNFYKAPFLCEGISLGLQKVNNQDVLILAGEGQIHVVKIDGLELIKKIQIP